MITEEKVYGRDYRPVSQETASPANFVAATIRLGSWSHAKIERQGSGAPQAPRQSRAHTQCAHARARSARAHYVWTRDYSVALP